ncbi:hypothetical protein JCM10207_006220 [Rhodosporidiobolus poonsookiae]
MRNKKAAAPLRSPTYPPPADDPFLVRPGASSASQPFSSAAFDRYMISVGERGAFDASAARPGPAGGAKEGGGLGKKLLSFQWTRSDKKHAVQQQQHIFAAAAPPSPTTTTAPAQLQTAASLPMGFPTPPLAGPSQHGFPQQHPSVAMFVPQHPQSNSSLSTVRTTSSFASTALFASSNDGWESEATSLSLTSSPESGRDSCSERGVPQQRMWRVRGLKAEPSTLGDIAEQEDVRSSIYDPSVSACGRSTPTRRNSTPVPRMVAMMLADPETPPRPKRFSTSSIQPSPTSPPFDPAYEAVAAARRRREASGELALDGSPRSIDGDDADDEVSPPRQRRPMPAAGLRKDRSHDDLLASTGGSFSATARIPSIRFEGISMDAVFAEVEKKLNGEVRAPDGSSAGEVKRAKRRSRVLSLYRPPSQPSMPSDIPPVPRVVEETPEPTLALSDSLQSLANLSLSRTSSFASDLSSRSGSITPTPAATSMAAPAPLDAPRPRQWPRRTSSRPSPLNVAAANALPSYACGPASAPLQAASPMYSPPAAHGVFSPVIPSRPPPAQLVSPPLAGAFSPTKLGPSSPGLGEPFNPSSSSSSSPRPDPSPALSTTSTFRPCDIPELLVCPPSPTQEELDRAARARERRASAVPPTSTVNGSTRVTVVQEKKLVRVSTRASTRRPRTYVSPPTQHVAAFSSPAPAPAPAPVRAPSALAMRRPSVSTTPPVSPTLPAFSTAPYQPPSVARTDFHPALSSSVHVSSASPASAPSSLDTPAPLNVDDDSSSDCEESLHNMLMRLNRPHTPPSTSTSSSNAAEETAASAGPTPSSSTGSLSLTELRLELHTTSHARLSMLAREMGAAVSSPSPSPSSAGAEKENRPPAPASPSASSSLLPDADAQTKRHRRLSRLYESDDSATRFGDAPLALNLALTQRPVSPQVTHPLHPTLSLRGDRARGRNFSSSEDGSDLDLDLEEGESAWDAAFPVPPSGPDVAEQEEDEEVEVDIEREINKTLASIVGTGGTTSTFSDDDDDLSSASPTRSQHAHTSSLSSLASSTSSGPIPGLSKLPRSESQSSTWTASTFDSLDADTDVDAEEGVVCLGERISCRYDVGVIGMAM